MADRTRSCSCANCGASPVAPAVSLDYCEGCEFLFRMSRGQFDTPWASDSENRAKRANARAELRAKAVAL